MVGHECIACGEKKSGNNEEGMICALCYLINGITTMERVDEHKKTGKTWKMF